MELIPPSYINLGNPPNLETCTRDTFEKGTVYTEQQLFKIAKSIASVCCHLHSKGINHGDLYAHNILINDDAHCLLGDYGAASFYDPTSDVAHHIERVEVKAFGHLLEDVLSVVDQKKGGDSGIQSSYKWKALIANCTSADVMSRARFVQVIEELSKF